MTSARLLLVAPSTSYRVGAYLNAARGIGVCAVVASDGRHSLISSFNQGIHIDPADVDGTIEVLLAEARIRPFAGVIGTDDGTVEIASRLARALGLPGNEPGAAVYTRRKDKARVRLRSGGVSVPRHAVMDIAGIARGNLPDIPFPVVLKPLAMSGSRGVIRADDGDAFRAAAKRIQGIVGDESDPLERRAILVERYLPGSEVALEGMLRNGQLSVLALFDKPDPMEGPFFEETYYVTPSRLPARIQERVVATAGKACAVLGLRQGPIHAELRVDGESAWILEIAARTIGGQCARMLTFGTNTGLEALVVAHALDLPVTLDAPQGASGVLMIPIPRAGVLRRVEGVLEAQKVPGIVDVEISRREGYELVPLPEGSSYLGFIFARADTPADAEIALREAHARLNVVIAPAWRIRSTD
ncbi:MAG: ATP-grasp domain-containing protein [Pseudomonadota bacterium]|nr:ATP-grasp domain-containing protein [Pseudomonadota bacterium]